MRVGVWVFFWPVLLSAQFCETYEECRSQFLERAHALLVHHKGTLTNWKVPSRDSDLFVDILHLLRPNSRKLWVLNSGTHGVEGYLGSTLQSELLEKWSKKKEPVPEGVETVFIHALNPYGMKYVRRVDENNVDLNRNCDISSSVFKNQNEGYNHLQGLLNPDEPLGSLGWGRIRGYFKALLLLSRNSLKEVRQAILKGQYQHPKGLYYGGQESSYQCQKLSELLQDASEQELLYLDLHTGYGAKGALHLFPSHKIGTAERKAYDHVFSSHPIEDPTGEDFYTTTGDIAKFASDVWKLKKGRRSISMTLEYGTFDNHKTLQSIESLFRMVFENQAFYYGVKDPRTLENLKTQFKVLYYPSDLDWRAKALNSLEVIQSFVQRFSKEG